MGEHSIFGETQSGKPVFNPSAGARTQKSVPCHGLFGTKLCPDDNDSAKPGIRPDRVLETLS